MKKDQTLYWITTGILSLMMLLSAFNYFVNPEAAEGFKHLGFPPYFRVELGLAKFIGIIVLLIPQFPIRVKEWAYACFGVVFISAAVAHYNNDDGIAKVIMPIIIFGMLAASNIYFHRVLKAKGEVA